MLKVWRAQSPSISNLGCSANQVVERQAVDLMEIYHQCLEVVLRVFGTRQKVKAFYPSFPNLVPPLSLAEFRMKFLIPLNWENRASGDNPQGPFFQVAALAKNNDIVLE
jgi:hypothetical protein